MASFPGHRSEAGEADSPVQCLSLQMGVKIPNFVWQFSFKSPQREVGQNII